MSIPPSMRNSSKGKFSSLQASDHLRHQGDTCSSHCFLGILLFGPALFWTCYPEQQNINVNHVHPCRAQIPIEWTGSIYMESIL
jgi:hypothetical protein